MLRANENLSQFLGVYPPSNCNSLRMSFMSSALHVRGNEDKTIGGYQMRDTKMHAALFSGLPVAAGVIILAAGRTRPTDTLIR